MFKAERSMYRVSGKAVAVLQWSGDSVAILPSAPSGFILQLYHVVRNVVQPYLLLPTEDQSKVSTLL